MTRPDWTREPLVHFLLAGAALFAFFLWFPGDDAADPNSRVINLDRSAQAVIAARFERTMGRAPTDAELDGAIANYVRDEVLYREALKLGLDQGDEVVRRRLISKMDLAAAAAARSAVPDEEVLRTWYETNQDRYVSDASLTFDQLYFASEDRAQAALLQTDPAGEPISLPATMSSADLAEIRSRFGEDFTRGLIAMNVGEEWRGPVLSGFGWHIIRLREKGGGVPKPFDQVRDQVEADWRSATARDRREQAYQILRDAYTINIDR